jgi:hypothetical protein
MRYVDIPANINGRPVIGIGNPNFSFAIIPGTTVRGAFFNRGIASVTIPNSILYIRQGAFNNNALTAVTIPGNVQIIGNDAFFNNQIESVTIEYGVRQIERGSIWQ